jgi:hypothetical protein
MRAWVVLAALFVWARPAVPGQAWAMPQPNEQGAPPASAPLLVWLPVHASEPDDALRAALACLFHQWTPSLTGLSFDVLVTLAGDARVAASLRARAADAVAAVSAGTDHIRPRPRVLAHPVVLATDVYDVDEAHGRRSSYAGPNALFYHVMQGLQDGSLRPESSAVAVAHGGGGSGGGGGGGQGIVVTTAMASYTFVHIMETDCCAAAHGWLDALLQPMLQDPHILISGSRGRGACWTGAEHGGCKPSVDPATPHAHLRDHINGNALYRLGPELGAMIEAARAKYRERVPFDVALHLIGGGDRAHDNARSYSVMALPVDHARFADPAYYGDADLAFVHAPRRLRVSSLEAVTRRLDVGKPVTVVVVPPAMTAADAALLAHLHAGLGRAGEMRNALFLAMDEAGHAAASQLAPLRVLLADDNDGGAGHQSTEARTARTLLDLARAGLTTFTIGLDTVILHPYSHHLSALAEERPQDVRWPSRAGASATLGPLLVPATAAASLQGWAESAGGGHAASAGTTTRPTLLASSLGRFRKGEQAPRSLPVHQHLPPDLFPPASSFVGPLWTQAARLNVAAVVTWDGDGMGNAPATPAALASVGLWSAPLGGDGGAPLTCANHSVLATEPLRLSSPASIHRALALHAAFRRFAHRHSIACVVLPGFWLGTTGTTVPAAAVLTADEAGAALVFPSLAALQDGTGGDVGHLIPFDGAAMPAPSKGEVTPASLPVFAPRLAALVEAALAALPPSYHCVLDGRRSGRDATLTSLDGRRLEAVAAAVRGLVGTNAPALLTGAWRHVGAWPTSTRIVTLADLAAPPTTADPMADLVRHSLTLSSRLASSPWAGIVEYAACQRAAAVHTLDTVGVPLATLDQVAALIPPAVLAEDLRSFNHWLSRPDRPASVAASKRATLVLPANSLPMTATDFHDAVLAPALCLAQAGGADVVALPRPPGARPWSALIGEAALAAAHAEHASLVPASVGWLLDGPLAPSSPSSSNNSTRLHLHPASVDVWRAAEHATAVRALEEAWVASAASRTTVHFPADAAPAQHARLKHFADGARAEVFTF